MAIADDIRKKMAGLMSHDELETLIANTEKHDARIAEERHRKELEDKTLLATKKAAMLSHADEIKGTISFPTLEITEALRSDMQIGDFRIVSDPSVIEGSITVNLPGAVLPLQIHDDMVDHSLTETHLFNEWLKGEELMPPKVWKGVSADFVKIEPFGYVDGDKILTGTVEGAKEAMQHMPYKGTTGSIAGATVQNLPKKRERLGSYHPFMREFCDMIGAPRNVTHLAFECNVGETAKVTLTYIPEVPDTLQRPVTQRFELMPIQEKEDGS